MKLIVHVGAHKTATTHIQQRMQTAQLALRDRRAIYLGPRDLRARVQFSNLLRVPGRWPKNEAAWRARIEAEEEGDAELCLISEENILGNMKPGELISADGRIYPDAVPRISAMIEMLGRKPDVIALGLREPASFINSAFGNWILSGDGVLFDDFIGEIDPRNLRWSELVARIIAGTGVETLMVWRIEDFGRVGGKVIERLIGKHRVPLLKPRQRDNVGWSRAGYDHLIAQLLHAEQGFDLGKAARKAREEFPMTGDAEPLQMIEPEILAESAQVYDEDWGILQRLPGVSPVIHPA